MKSIKSINLGLFILLSFIVIFSSSCGKKDEEIAKEGSVDSSVITVADSISIESYDNMKYSVDTFKVESGKSFNLTLKNSGTMPKRVMQHNWVLLAEGVDPDEFSLEAMTQINTGYLPKIPDPRVLAHTKMLGSNEADSITLNAPDKPGKYPFVCTFPGHCASGMKGVVEVF